MGIRGKLPISSKQKNASVARTRNPHETIQLTDREMICPSSVLGDARQKHYWDFYLGLDEFGLIAKLDSNLLVRLCEHSSYCDQYAKAIAASVKAGDLPDSIMLREHRQQSEQIRKLLSEMGLSPTARNRFKQPEASSGPDPALKYLDV